MHSSLKLALGLLVSTSVAACGSSSNGSGGAHLGNTDGGGGAGAGGSGNGGDGAYVPPTGAPVTGTPGQWTWIPVDGALCRDGSPAGFGVSFSPTSSDKVAVMLMGGGACYNAATCNANPKNFDSSTIATTAATGIFDRTQATNPIKDWNLIYVPFCTGDVFAGARENVTIDGYAGTQQFVGYKDMGLFLDRIVPTFPHASQVLWTGFSAGGFGAALTSDLAARKFPPGTNITLLDDSGPPLGTDALPTCLQQGWRDTWGFEDTFLKDCGADCPDHSNYSQDWAFHLAKAHPSSYGGLVETTDDSVITLFYGFGANNCQVDQTKFPAAVTGDVFQAGLLDFRAKITAKTPKFGTYYITGSQHTWTETASVYTENNGGVALIDWIGNLITGSVSQVGP